MERSIRRINPLTKFDTTFCKPNPIPTPIAPPKIANVERSSPTVESAMAKLTKTSVTRRILARVLAMMEANVEVF